MTAREQLLAALDRPILEYAGANKISKPVVDQVKQEIRNARLRGIRPTIACLGQKQYDILDKHCEVLGEIGAPGYVCRLRIVWTNDADLVSVFEERKGGWV